ncbi:hypothetical protein FY034_13345 [Trichlorobacter lovleyi]|uniref:hypothetical protein n=1 Tax=Trichlorobacter lovleyi TaxID=313985 RepID=UPI0022400176|nr:hypothetical protein [Trichlorobacter lovleyi]QOX79875.1 hypothetical protein FY034_13345 [Trichlorobacter lovleyi]
MLRAKLPLTLALVVVLSGIVYAGEPGYTPANDSGCKVFNSSVEPDDSVTWSGSCKGGYASGSGTLQWFSNGNPAGSYDGEMSNGKRHGTGTYKWTDGSSYTGGWANGQMNGKGVYTLKNGTKDDASFKDGKYEGIVIRLDRNGTIIEYKAKNNEFELVRIYYKDINGCNVGFMYNGGVSEWVKSQNGSGYIFDWVMKEGDSSVRFLSASERIIQARWNGKCVNNLAEGRGKLELDVNVSKGWSGSVNLTYTFSGTMFRGKFRGPVEGYFAGRMDYNTPIVNYLFDDKYFGQNRVEYDTYVAQQGLSNWSIDPATECKVYNPAPDPNDTLSWSGGCKDGYAHGSGVLQWYVDNNQAAGRYQGEMLRGKRHGSGTYKWQNGNSYAGGWAYDKLHGNGRMTLVDGKMYDSYYVNGEVYTPDTRTGCRIFNAEPKPEQKVSWTGKCQAGYATGTGILTWYSNGQVTSTYKGGMRSGKKHGKGELVIPGGIGNYTGDYVDGKRHGKGIAIHKNGRYEGAYSNDMRNGYGVYYFNDGDTHTGEWKDDMQNGYGTYYEARSFFGGSRTCTGTWVDGKKGNDVSCASPDSNTSSNAPSSYCNSGDTCFEVVKQIDSAEVKIRCTKGYRVGSEYNICSNGKKWAAGCGMSSSFAHHHNFREAGNLACGN